MAKQAVFITGAGQGIGYALCRAFAAQGAQVALNDLDPAKAEQAAEAINVAVNAERVRPFAGDAADVSAMGALINRFADEAGALDVVIANAGVTRYVPFLDSTPENFDQIVSVNLRGTYFLAQAAARRMIADGKAGRIILLSSVVGLRAFPNFSIYSMTKAGIAMMAASLALELGPHGITVNAVSPGATLTERTLREDPNYEAGWGQVTPNGRVNSVEDITAPALFLASPAAQQINGQNWVIDGGWTLASPLPPEHPHIPEKQDYA
jgi:3-oxoacyl-[acyl-carrier protein] reductase